MVRLPVCHPWAPGGLSEYFPDKSMPLPNSKKKCTNTTKLTLPSKVQLCYLNISSCCPDHSWYDSGVPLLLPRAGRRKKGICLRHWRLLLFILTPYRLKEKHNLHFSTWSQEDSSHHSLGWRDCSPHTFNIRPGHCFTHLVDAQLASPVSGCL